MELATHQKRLNVYERYECTTVKMCKESESTCYYRYWWKGGKKRFSRRQCILSPNCIMFIALQYDTIRCQIIAKPINCWQNANITTPSFLGQPSLFVVQVSKWMRRHESNDLQTKTNGCSQCIGLSEKQRNASKRLDLKWKIIDNVVRKMLFTSMNFMYRCYCRLSVVKRFPQISVVAMKVKYTEIEKKCSSYNNVTKSVWVCWYMIFSGISYHFWILCAKMIVQRYPQNKNEKKPVHTSNE